MRTQIDTRTQVDQVDKAVKRRKRNSYVKTLGDLGPKDLRRAKIADLMQAKLKTDYLNSKEILEGLKPKSSGRIESKIPKWTLANNGELYLSIGELPGDTNRTFALVWCAESKCYPMYGVLQGNKIIITDDVWLTIPAPVKTKTVDKKLKILTDEMREKNAIGEAIHFFHTPRHPLKLWKMNIRGLLEDPSIGVDKTGNITLSGGKND